jgi:hypothetical protein
MFGSKEIRKLLASNWDEERGEIEKQGLGVYRRSNFMSPRLGW